MSSTDSPKVPVVRGDARVEVLFDELGELTGQRNAIDGRIVQIVAELDRDELCGATGARSVAAVVAWKLGTSSGNAKTIATIAHRLAEFPRCAAGMREGRLSLDGSGSSPVARRTVLMSIMRSWRPTPRCRSCAPR
jgi:hypothetical protein